MGKEIIDICFDYLYMRKCVVPIWKRVMEAITNSDSNGDIEELGNELGIEDFALGPFAIMNPPFASFSFTRST